MGRFLFWSAWLLSASAVADHLTELRRLYPMNDQNELVVTLDPRARGRREAAVLRALAGEPGKELAAILKTALVSDLALRPFFLQLIRDNRLKCEEPIFEALMNTILYAADYGHRREALEILIQQKIIPKKIEFALRNLPELMESSDPFREYVICSLSLLAQSE